MSFFPDLNQKISDNLYAHGHYLTDPHADDPAKVAETVENLMEFVAPDARDKVRAQVLKLIHDNHHEELELAPAQPPEADRIVP